MLKAIILIGGPSKGMWNFDLKCKLRILVMTTWQMAKKWYYRHPVVLVPVGVFFFRGLLLCMYMYTQYSDSVNFQVMTITQRDQH